MELGGGRKEPSAALLRSQPQLQRAPKVPGCEEAVAALCTQTIIATLANEHSLTRRLLDELDPHAERGIGDGFGAVEDLRVIVR